jgi:hypothetical protein
MFPKPGFRTDAPTTATFRGVEERMEVRGPARLLRGTARGGGRDEAGVRGDGAVRGGDDRVEFELRVRVAEGWIAFSLGAVRAA